MIRDGFADLIEEATRGEHDEDWASSDLGALALILILDQFPRNIFRDDARSYAGDAKALEVSLATQARGSWIELEPDHKHFILVPMMHSEALEVQEASLSLLQPTARKMCMSTPSNIATSLSALDGSLIAIQSWVEIRRPKSLNLQTRGSSF